VLAVESRIQSDNFPSQFQPLAVNMNTLVFVVAAADYEMSFSIMNTTITCARSSVLLKTTAILMLICLVGLPITEFNPEEYNKEWLKFHSHTAYIS
jgi:hypothetical protein